MTPEDLSAFETWFDDFVAGFLAAAPRDHRHYDLKTVHTRRVRAAATTVARALGVPRRLRALGETAALFHDVGRFPQFARYRTFRDPDSVNHAWLSLRTLNRAGILRRLPKPERHLVSKAVLFHNRKDLPGGLRGDALFLCALVRDADKVDIFRVFDDHEARDGGRDPVIQLGLNPDGPVTEATLAAVARRRIPDYRTLSSVADFRLLRASWVYDIHFHPALALLRDRGDLRRLAARLPDTPAVRKALASIIDDMENRIRSATNLTPVPST